MIKGMELVVNPIIKKLKVMGLVVIITSIKCTKLVVDRAGGDCYQGYGAGGDKNSITILGPVVIIPIIMANWH